MSKQQHITGVNLGGWLVLEKWMTPSLFADTDAVDEFTLSKTLGGKEKIEKHRQEFITETDFVWLKDHGITAVRLPIGYWAIANYPPFISAVKQLDLAFAWAEKHGIKILLDFHGAIGSQNGKVHSGRVGKINWLNDGNQSKNLNIIEQLAKRYGQSTALWGIEIINEPKFGRTSWKLRQFYKKAYAIICEHARTGTLTVFSDAYAPLLMTGALRAKPNFPVAMDVHFYQVYGRRDRARSIQKQIQQADAKKRLIRLLGLRQPLIIGEWSGAIPQKANDEEIRRYIATQRQAFRHTKGDFFWSYKMEGGGAWNFRQLVEKNLW